MAELLFVYGTLAPADADSATRQGWMVDAVRGRMFDLGEYPGLVDCMDPSAGWVEGFVRAVDRHELENRLDRYEDVDAGLYQRVVASTRLGRRVWIYEYARPIPPGARGPLTHWDGRRVDLFNLSGM